MILIKAEIIHNWFTKGKVVFDLSDINFACESMTRYTDDPMNELNEYNEVESLDICFKNGKCISVIRTAELCKSLWGEE